MRRVLSLALTATMALPLAATQRPAPGAGAGFILGRVVDADTGQPVAGVVVSVGAAVAAVPSTSELVSINSGPPGVTATQRSLTGDDGRFLLRDLTRGRYTVTITAPGYVPGTFGQNRPNGPGQWVDLSQDDRIGDVVIRAWKYGAISGTVLDEHGDPAVGVSLRYLRRVIAGGQARFAPVAAPSTDDRGMFRASGLVPGDYVVGVMVNQETLPSAVVNAYSDAMQGGNPNQSSAYRSLSFSGSASFSGGGFRVGEHLLRTGPPGLSRPAPGADGRVMTYAPLFYPSAHAPSQATQITVKSGEERAGIDLRLRLVPGFRVSGRVIGPDGPGSFLAMTLVHPTGTDFQSEGTAEAASGASDGNGLFTFLGIPPGQYLLKIRRYPRPVPGPSTTIDGASRTTPAGRGASVEPPESAVWAVAPIVVGNADLTDVNVTLRPGLRVSGSIESSGAAAPPAPLVQRMTVALQSAEGRTSAPIAVAARIAADGTFTTAGYQGGRYIVAVAGLPPGWTLASARLGSRDVSVEPFELSDRDVAGVVLSFTNQSTQISGTVTGPSGPDIGAEVIVFPADSTAWKDIGVPARRSRNERVDRGGRYSAGGLPAGEYFVVAVPSAAIRDWNDPKFLETLIPRAVRVALGDGEKQSVDLKTAVVR
jgi:hypothetical protein